MKLTLSLILINVLGFFYSLTDFENIISSYAFNPIKFLHGEHYRIITSMFLHANFLHLAFNMLALFILGSAIEKKINSLKYFIVYTIGGVGSNLIMMVPLFFSPESMGVGASGAISAVIGLGTFYSPGKFVSFPTFIPIPFVISGAFYFITQYMNLFAPSQIAYPVHLFGMLIGSIFGLIWVKGRINKIVIFLLALILVIIFPYIIKYVIMSFIK